MSIEEVLTAAPTEVADSSAADTSDVQDQVVQDQGTDDVAQDQTQDQDQDQAAPDQKADDTTKEEDLSEWHGSVAARLRELGKQAPELNAVLTKYPKVRDSIAATFRREAAFREIYPTVAEAQQMRDYFPRGLEDVQTVIGELDEVGKLDQAFYTRDREGNYPGHAEFVDNLFQQDRQATVALLKNVPKQWARLDPESYADTFSSIIASTFANDRIADRIAQTYNRAKAGGDADTQNDMVDLWNYVTGFGKKPEADTPEAKRLRQERQDFDLKRRKAQEEDAGKFHTQFVADSKHMQQDIINKNPLIQKLPQAISPAKKAKIVEDIRGRIIAHLQRSRSFMNALNPAYESMNMKAAMDVQRGAWQQPWLVNMYIRKVLAEETPGIVQGNQTANAKKKAAAQRTDLATRRTAPQAPVTQNAQQKPKPKFSIDDILRGRDLVKA